MYGIAYCPVEYSDELKSLGFAGTSSFLSVSLSDTSASQAHSESPPSLATQIQRR